MVSIPFSHFCTVTKLCHACLAILSNVYNLDIKNRPIILLSNNTVPPVLHSHSHFCTVTKLCHACLAILSNVYNLDIKNRPIILLSNNTVPPAYRSNNWLQYQVRAPNLQSHFTAILIQQFPSSFPRTWNEALTFYTATGLQIGSLIAQVVLSFLDIVTLLGYFPQASHELTHQTSTMTVPFKARTCTKKHKKVNICLLNFLSRERRWRKILFKLLILQYIHVELISEKNVYNLAVLNVMVTGLASINWVWKCACYT